MSKLDDAVGGLAHALSGSFVNNRIHLMEFASVIIEECLRTRTIDEQWGGVAPVEAKVVSAKPCPFCGCEVRIIPSDDPGMESKVDHPEQATLFLHPCVLSGTTWLLGKWNDRRGGVSHE